MATFKSWRSAINPPKTCNREPYLSFPPFSRLKCVMVSVHTLPTYLSVKHWKSRPFFSGKVLPKEVHSFITVACHLRLVAAEKMYIFLTYRLIMSFSRLKRLSTVYLLILLERWDELSIKCVTKPSKNDLWIQTVVLWNTLFKKEEEKTWTEFL